MKTVLYYVHILAVQTYASEDKRLLDRAGPEFPEGCFASFSAVKKLALKVLHSVKTMLYWFHSVKAQRDQIRYTGECRRLSVSYS